MHQEINCLRTDHFDFAHKIMRLCKFYHVRDLDRIFPFNVVEPVHHIREFNLNKIAYSFISIQN